MDNVHAILRSLEHCCVTNACGLVGSLWPKLWIVQASEFAYPSINSASVDVKYTRTRRLQIHNNNSFGVCIMMTDHKFWIWPIVLGIRV